MSDLQIFLSTGNTYVSPICRYRPFLTIFTHTCQFYNNKSTITSMKGTLFFHVHVIPFNPEKITRTKTDIIRRLMTEKPDRSL